jgi:hypothetical protein
MKKLKNSFRLLVTVLLLGGWLLAASALHVVWTGNKAIIIPKNRIGVRETYVNTSAWSADDVTNHPTLVKRLVETGHTDAVAAAFKDIPTADLPGKINEAIAKTPTTKPSDVIGDRVDQVVQKTHDVAEQVKGSIAR